ncbi:hypothetical protein PsYK624_071520 [Phanerochaete sordida]|uniref:Uncharacterized protein n=1 Tax=Phanerochaete sordida TaxID=48140 RepID=A0A9P3GAW6_9APHY|nr:hypothetical protein PsYK624_071520 [Phanerochaete sordida]
MLRDLKVDPYLAHIPASRSLPAHASGTSTPAPSTSLDVTGNTASSSFPEGSGCSDIEIIGERAGDKRKPAAELEGSSREGDVQQKRPRIAPSGTGSMSHGVQPHHFFALHAKPRSAAPGPSADPKKAPLQESLLERKAAAPTASCAPGSAALAVLPDSDPLRPPLENPTGLDIPPSLSDPSAAGAIASSAGLPGAACGAASTSAIESAVTSATSVASVDTPSGSQVVSVSTASVTVTRSRPSHDEPLPLPAGSTHTRSERVFMLATGQDPRSLRIGSGDEYMLFMKLRENEQWWTCTMTPSSYADAAALYNNRLAKQAEEKGLTVVPKNPRALYDKLAEIEGQVLKRIHQQNFKSQGGTEEFWRRHCFAVPLGKGTDAQTVAAAAQKGKKTNKRGTCSRCAKILYPNGTGGKGNHGKLCSDGFPPHFSDKNAAVALWPQPKGIYLNDGTSFSASGFLTTLRSVYHRAVIDGVPLDMEQQAFAFTMRDRLDHTVLDGVPCFELWPEPDMMLMAGTPADLIIEVTEGARKGKKYLRLECLRDII